MGKRFLGLFIALAVILCAGCGREESDEQTAGETADIIENTTDSGSMSDNSLNMILDTVGRPMSSIFSTNDGCYMYAYNFEHNGCNMFYVDYKTRKRVYLSPSVNGEYWLETDTSFFPDSGCIEFFVHDGALYTSVGSSTWTLYKMDLNGQNRKELYRHNGDGYIDVSSYIAADQEFLYFLAYYDYGTGEISTKLCALDKDTGGEIQVVYEFEGAGVSAEGFFDRKLVWSEGRLCDDLETYEYKLGILDIDTGEISELMTWKDNEHSFIENIGDKSLWYYFDLKEGTVVCYDLRTQKETVVLDTVPFVWRGDRYSKVWGETDGDYLKIQYDEDYIVNLKTKEVKKNPNTLKGEGGQLASHALYPAGASKDEFLVEVKENEYELISEHAPGFSGRQTICYYDYAMIKKEDYYNNRPNYMMIEDMQVREGTPVS